MLQSGSSDQRATTRFYRQSLPTRLINSASRSRFSTGPAKRIFRPLRNASKVYPPATRELSKQTRTLTSTSAAGERFTSIRPGGQREPLLYDPKGYFVISIDPEQKEIILRHYLPNHTPAHEMRGRGATSMLLGLLRDGLVTQLSHERNPARRLVMGRAEDLVIGAILRVLDKVDREWSQSRGSRGEGCSGLVSLWRLYHHALL